MLAFSHSDLQFNSYSCLVLKGRIFDEARILTGTAAHRGTQTLAIGSSHQVKPAVLLLLLQKCPCEANRRKYE